MGKPGFLICELILLVVAVRRRLLQDTVCVVSDCCNGSRVDVVMVVMDSRRAQSTVSGT